MRRGLAVVAVVVLVALAGCSGGIPGINTGPGGDDGGSETADVEALSEQSWASENESVAFDDLLQQHRWTLQNASTYRFSQGLHSNTGREADTKIAVNHDAARVNLTTESKMSESEPARTQATFAANGTVYTKSEADDGYEYRQADENLTGESFDSFVSRQSQISVSVAVFEAIDFEYTGVEDGAYVFEADSISESDRWSVDPENVTSMSARLAVDPDGYVRTLSLSLTLDRGDGEETASITVHTTGVNETSVSEPSWTDEAESEE